MIVPAALLLLTVQPVQAIEPAVLQAGPPMRIAEIDSGRLKGDPARLAWSEDGTELYLQTVEHKDGAAVQRHYLIAASGGKPAAVSSQPEWAAKYWAWKSAQAAPGAPEFKISVESERRLIRATAMPRGAGIAGMGGDPGAGMATGSGRAGGGDPVTVGEAQNAIVYRLRLGGEVIGEWINAPAVPGETFGWSPPALGLIAYVNREGKVVMLNAAGRARVVAGTSSATLPAWSEDGTKLAFLKKTGRKKYELTVAAIGPERLEIR